MLVIGIAGGTGSGKTTVGRKIMDSFLLMRWLFCHRIPIIVITGIFHWRSHFDHRAAIELDLLVKHTG